MTLENWRRLLPKGSDTPTPKQEKASVCASAKRDAATAGQESLALLCAWPPGEPYVKCAAHHSRLLLVECPVLTKPWAGWWEVSKKEETEDNEGRGQQGSY